MIGYCLPLRSVTVDDNNEDLAEELTYLILFSPTSEPHTFKRMAVR